MIAEIRTNEGRAKSLTVVACQTCGATDQKVRAMRSRTFTIFMCDPCSLDPLVNHEGREFKLSAVAMEAM